MLVRRAVLSGVIIKAPCVRCANENTVAHHEDYSKPLSVIWLCRKCHMARHAEMRVAAHDNATNVHVRANSA